MRRYKPEIRRQIIKLRSEGYTYQEICDAIGLQIPKGTLSYICKKVTLTPPQLERLILIKRERMMENQIKAVAANKRILANKLATYRETNLSLKPFLHDRRTKLVALAMLYWGRAQNGKAGEA